MKEIFWVGIGGFMGANARFLIGGWMLQRFGGAFPYGTFAINISGSFLLGLLAGLLESHAIHPAVRPSIAIGFLGAYTTFSTWTYETIRLVESGSLAMAGLNIFGSLLVGLLATVAGLALGRGF